MKGDRRSQRSSPACINARPENTPHPVRWPVIVDDEACEWHLTGVLQSNIRLTATRVSTVPASPACSTELDSIPYPNKTQALTLANPEILGTARSGRAPLGTSSAPSCLFSLHLVSGFRV